MICNTKPTLLWASNTALFSVTPTRTFFHLNRRTFSLSI